MVAAMQRAVVVHLLLHHPHPLQLCGGGPHSSRALLLGDGLQSRGGGGAPEASHTQQLLTTVGCT